MKTHFGDLYPKRLSDFHRNPRFSPKLIRKITNDHVFQRLNQKKGQFQCLLSKLKILMADKQASALKVQHLRTVKSFYLLLS